jgi:hypothetical protein
MSGGKHEMLIPSQPVQLITTQTDLMSMRSSINSEENLGNTATTSLLEGAVGVQLPQSKICTAAAR